MFYRLKRRDFLKNSTHKFIGLLEVSFFALEELSNKILKKYQRVELSGIRGCEVAFCLGSLLKTVRKFEIDQKRSNALFVNDFLRNLLCASSGDEYIEKDYFGKSAVSEISSCKREVPKVLKENANNPDVAHNLTENLVSYAQQNLPNGIYNSMTAEILRLCAKNNKTQQSIFIKLSNEVAQHNSSTTSNDSEFQQLAKFLSLALIEAVKTTNMIEAGSTITARGNSSLCVVAGSIFNFAFGNRSKKQKYSCNTSEHWV